jgi:hypothetical protein
MLPPIADILNLICWAVIGVFRSRASLEAEILTLRQQLNVLRRKSPARQSHSRRHRQTHRRSRKCLTERRHYFKLGIDVGQTWVAKYMAKRRGRHRKDGKPLSGTMPTALRRWTYLSSRQSRFGYFTAC